MVWVLNHNPVGDRDLNLSQISAEFWVTLSLEVQQSRRACKRSDLYTNQIDELGTQLDELRRLLLTY